MILVRIRWSFAGQWLAQSKPSYGQPGHLNEWRELVGRIRSVKPLLVVRRKSEHCRFIHGFDGLTGQAGEGRTTPFSRLGASA